MNKKSKITLALILVIVLFTGVLAPVASAIDKIAARAAITKILKVPVGTTLPTGSFEYVITPVSITYLPDMPPDQLPPVVGTGTVSIAVPTEEGPCTCTTPCAADVVHYYRESEELFGNVVWPHPGIFEYRITETPNTIINLQTGENMSYSQAAYKVRVHIREDGTGGWYLFNIAAFAVVFDDGTLGHQFPAKVDPTPGGEEPYYYHSQMAFQNIYTKHTGGAGTDTMRSTLSVHNFLDVAEAFESLYYPEMYYDYTMTVTRPSLITEPTTVYKAYVVQDGAITGLTNIADNGLTAAGSDSGGAYANITSGQSFTFKLMNKQKLVFTNTHVGSSYAVGVTVNVLYTPRVVIFTAGSFNSPTMIGERDSTLMVPTAGSVYPTNPLVGDDINTNRAVFNMQPNFIVDPDLGLNISDLPFYGLILLALSGIVVLLIIKARSRKRYY